MLRLEPARTLVLGSPSLLPGSASVAADEPHFFTRIDLERNTAEYLGAAVGFCNVREAE